MKSSKLKIKNFRVLFCILHFAFLISAGMAQSTSQSYPTAITSNEISGKIPARDIGDARLTDYFYTFNGNQGDIFINVQTSNFNGDIDVFTAGNLKPLTKITIYADDTMRETGRVVYLRQPMKLVLRVEGRSPNDDAATFQIKFAGSFAPAEAAAETSAPETPAVKSENLSNVRVNSVGTIIEVKPKPQTPPKETIAKKETKPRRKTSANTAKNKEDAKEKETAPNKEEKAENKEIATEERKEQTAVEKTDAETEKVKENPNKIEEKAAPVVVVTDNTAKQDALPADAENLPKEKKENSAETAKNPTPKSSAKASAKSRLRSKAAQKTKEPNPLESIHLIILFKDGTRIERAMSEVVKFSVDKGVLVVVATDGSIGRYSILDVAKMTVE